MARRKQSKNTPKTNIVYQQEEFGCAAAVIAMALRKTYEEVSADFLNDFNTEGISLESIIEYLGNAGFSIVHSYVTNYADKNFARNYLLTPFAPKHVVRVLPQFDAEHSHVIFMDADGTLYDPSGRNEEEIQTYYQITDVVGLFTTDDTEFFKHD